MDYLRALTNNKLRLFLCPLSSNEERGGGSPLRSIPYFVLLFVLLKHVSRLLNSALSWSLNMILNSYLEH
jgi:hypothetical protein